MSAPTARRLRFGIKPYLLDATYEDILRVWREADALPAFEHAWDFDHFMPYCLEGWTLLAALAAQTERIRLGVMVTGNTYRHPAVLANIGATVDIISHGRLDFGIGAAWNESEHTAYGIPLYTPGERLRRLGEACEVIRRLWTETSVTFEGQYYQLKDATCDPRPLQRPCPPFVIGGSGEQLTLRVVAQYADIWNYLCGSVEDFRHKCAVLDEHCRAIGRDPAAIERSIQFRVDPTDLAGAREQVTEYVRAGATHVILTVLYPYPEGIARRLAAEVAEPILAEH